MSSIIYAVKSLRYSTRKIKNILFSLSGQLALVFSESNLFKADDIIEQAIDEFNKTDRQYDLSASMLDIFSLSVMKNSGNLAVDAIDTRLTYAELDIASDVLALELLRNGAGPGVYVGVLLQRNSQLIISLLATIKAGGSFIPMDPEFPTERLNQMLATSSASLLISTLELSDKVAFEGVMLDPFEISESCSSVTNDLRFRPVDSSTVAYVIFTSGSTGVPKGVMIEHSNVVNFVESMHEILQLPDESRVLCLTTASFDIFLLEVFVTLFKGHSVNLASEIEQKDPIALANYIQEKNINVVQITPSRLRVLAAGEIPISSFFNGVERLLVGGEAFPENSLVELQSIENIRLFNLYGPTETTVWSCVSELTHRDTATIGTPIANTKVYILDERREMVPIGTIGSLYIAGSGLARGYLNDLERTNEVYVENPFEPGTRMYHTGDLGAWTTQGELEYHGRSDSQVKHLGYRIELTEIDTALNSCIEVASGCVVVRKKAADRSVLIAYCTATFDVSSREFSAAVKQHLVEILPRYMVPDFVVMLEDMPLTPNSKIDRSKLTAELDSSLGQYSDEFDLELNSEEGLLKFLRATWQTVLETNDFDNTTSFFDAGGDSFSLVILHNKISKKFPNQLEIADVFSNPTIQALYDFLTAKLNQKLVQPESVSGKIPPSTIHFGSAYLTADHCIQQPESMTFELNDEVWATLEGMASYYESIIIEVTLGLFTLYAFKVLREDVISVDLSIGNQWKQYDVSYTEQHSIDDVLKFVAHCGRKESSHVYPQETELQRDRRYSESRLSILFLDASSDCVFAKNSNIHDIVFTVCCNSHTVTVEFNESIIDSEKMYTFTKEFAKTLEHLILTTECCAA